MSIAYHVEQVTKRYGRDVLANDNLSLDIEKGQIYGILGPNGAGKSTLVHQMVGLIRPDSGRILYNGHAVGPGDRDFKRRLAFLPQRPMALLDLTVFEAIAFTGRLRGLPARSVRGEAHHLIEILGLTGCAQRLVANLSGGQHRLVSLGTALIGSPETLVLDEPTAQLDPDMRRRVWDILRERVATRGDTIVLVTHNPLEAEQVIDHLAILYQGRIIASGPTSRLKEQVESHIRIVLTLRDRICESVAKLDSLGEVAWTAPDMVTVWGRGDAIESLVRRTLEIVPLEALKDLRIVAPTLEDVYLDLTRREGLRQASDLHVASGSAAADGRGGRAA